MSVAGRRSHWGDDYQLRVATHWLARMLLDSAIESVQVEAVTRPGAAEIVTVDDTVVSWIDGRQTFVQSKKNETDFKYWKLSDPILKKELIAARDQLEKTNNAIAEFCSRTPFGDLAKLVEGCSDYTNSNAFLQNAAATLKEPFAKIVELFGRTEEETFSLVRCLKIGPHHTIEGWKEATLGLLRTTVPNADYALLVCERLVIDGQTGFDDAPSCLKRAYVYKVLGDAGIFPLITPAAEVVRREFRMASAIGRDWVRSIGNYTIDRSEVSELFSIAVDEPGGCILLTDGPGTGKTCVLLSLAERVEESSDWDLLFIKADQFAECKTEEELSEKGLPTQIAEKCGWIAEHKRLMVIVDSLDVLSLHREHKSLQLFLRLIDQLGRIKGATVVVACRSFDLDYDPHLSSRSWKHRVELRPLSLSEVAAVLNAAGIKGDNLTEEFSALLVVPQNLRLFVELAKKSASDGSDTRAIETLFQLHAHFIDVMVRRDEFLGDDVFNRLGDLADTMMQKRRLSVPIASVGFLKPQLQRLISSGILRNPNQISVEFGHQTLLDAVCVVRAMSRNQSLVDFIACYPQFPFIRPAVQAYVGYLHSMGSVEFYRQVRRVLSSNIAYHLKRLVVETFANAAPATGDEDLVKWLSRDHEELFWRLFSLCQGEKWFRLFADHWYQTLIDSKQDIPARVRFLSSMERWVNTVPGELIQLWQASLSFENPLPQISWLISLQLKSFIHWSLPGVTELLNALVSTTYDEHDMVGVVLSQYVDATGLGHNQLWTWMTRQPDTPQSPRDAFVRSRPHNFNDANFLSRTVSSLVFLDLVLSTVDRQTSTEHQSVSLHSTSWADTHQKGLHRHDEARPLFDAIENYLCEQSSQDTEEWKVWEPRLRGSHSLALRYILIQAYMKNVVSNITGIEEVLTTRDLYDRTDGLSFELRELTQFAFASLSEEFQDAHQQSLLLLHQEQSLRNGTDVWSAQSLVRVLTKIPCIFRTPQSQKFVDSWREQFLDIDKLQVSHGWCTVNSPATSEQLLTLSTRTLQRLLEHYENSDECWERIGGTQFGGFPQLRRELSVMAAKEPLRYLEVVSLWQQSDRHPDARESLLEGIANHLQYRSNDGLNSPSNWEFVDCEVREVLSGLLDVLELDNSMGELQLARAVDACVGVSKSEDCTRVAQLLLSLTQASDPTKERIGSGTEESQVENFSDSLNSARGVAAEAAMKLANSVLERDDPMPSPLIPVIRLFAGDPVAAVRASVLSRLPYFMDKENKLGWELLAIALKSSIPHLWPEAERCLYYKLAKEFEMVAPYLSRLLTEAPSIGGAAWGRLAMLSCLHGHLSIESIFSLLEANDVESQWKGAIQVLAVNLRVPEHQDTCLTGLLRVLDRRPTLESTIWQVSRNLPDAGPSADSLVRSLLEALTSIDGRVPIDVLTSWVAAMAVRNPVTALPLLEKIVGLLDSDNSEFRISDGKPLIIALVQIMREAELSEDQDVIKRAMGLQDRCLVLGVTGIEEMLNSASSRH